MYKFLWGFILGIISLAPLHAQNLSLEGIIKDEHSKPLSSVTVVLEPGRLETLTARDGSFQYQSLFPGTYRIFCTHTGFESYEDTITIQAHQKNFTAIVLRPRAGCWNMCRYRCGQIPAQDNLIKTEHSAMPVQVITP